MEWVETTGKTVEEAKDAALDQLGVDEEDAEFEVVEEPRSGLFGRLRQEARVRARVRPTRPRPKQERRDRRRSNKRRDDRSDDRRDKPQKQGGRRGGGGGRQPSRSAPDVTPREEATVDDELDAAGQAEIVRTFLEGLVDAFAVGASTTVEIDDETIEARIEGGDLGLLIGPRGQTLAAVQELTRTVVQRHSVGVRHARVLVDVAGYRERRRVALERFTRELAEEVVRSGMAKALEPMGSSDRKVVHDTVNDIDGVATISEGEEPRRRVVIVPSGAED